jgi:hypothetical protein
VNTHLPSFRRIREPRLENTKTKPSIPSHDLLDLTEFYEILNSRMTVAPSGRRDFDLRRSPRSMRTRHAASASSNTRARGGVTKTKTAAKGLVRASAKRQQSLEDEIARLDTEAFETQDAVLQMQVDLDDKKGRLKQIYRDREIKKAELTRLEENVQYN